MKQRKNNKTVKLQISDWQKIQFILQNLPMFLLTRILPYISRLPVIEDYFRENLYHYENRKLLIFKETLEGPRRREKIEVYFIEGDRYHLTFFLRLMKPLTLAQAKKKIKRVITLGFGKLAENVIVKLHDRTGEILVPREILKA